MTTKRTPHYIRKPTWNTRLNHCVYLDAEANRVFPEPNMEVQTLRLGCALHKRRNTAGVWTKGEWCDFTTCDQLADFLEAKAYKGVTLKVFAHNFDYDVRICGLLKTLPERGWELRKSVFGNGPFILMFHRGTSKIRLLCTMNHFKQSLADLGETVGYPKLTMPGYDEPDEVWWPYCRRDVEVLATVVELYEDRLNALGMGPMKATAAQQALHGFNKRYMAHKMFCHCEPNALNLAKQSLYGGRTEAFYLGKSKQPGYKVDYNSHYPSVMRDMLAPIHLADWRQDPKAAHVEMALAHGPVIAHCEIDTPEPVYPSHDGQRLLFQTGRFPTYLADAEFRDAWRAGRVSAVYSLAAYVGAPIFTQFVDDLYGMRQEAKRRGDKVDVALLKLLLNSLFGKYGQKGYHSEVVGKARPDEVWVQHLYDVKGAGLGTRRALGGVVTTSWEEGFAFDSMPEISACITALGRMKMANDYRVMGWKDLIYSDTDSHIVTPEGYSRLGCPGQSDCLGALALEEGPCHYEIRGLKDYTFGERTRTKGVRGDAVELVPGTYRHEFWQRLSGSLQNGTLDSVVIHHGWKEMKRDYKKGHRLPDGTIVPFRRA